MNSFYICSFSTIILMLLMDTLPVPLNVYAFAQKFVHNKLNFIEAIRSLNPSDHEYQT